MEVSSNVGPSVKEKAVFSILRFLEESLNDKDVSDESKESIEGNYNVYRSFLSLILLTRVQSLWSAFRQCLR